MTRRPRGTHGYFQFRGLEPLEQRELLAGHSFAGFQPFARAGFAAAQFAGFEPGVQRFSVQSSSGDAEESQRTAFVATLSDEETGATGRLVVKSYVEDGTTETRLKVRVTGAEANATLDVTIAGVVVGQLTTNENGAGTLRLSSDPEDNEQALPDDFPTDLAAGAAVSVGSLTGTLENFTRGGRGGCHAGTSIRRTATLSDPENFAATGTAKYTSSTYEGTTTTRLVVNVGGAAAETALDVSIDELIVGQVNTDASGNGSLVLSSNPTGDEQPVPANFPAIDSGSVIRVGSSSGTFDNSGGHAAARFRGFRF